jgi:small-conductance mechanosensitive channel
LLIVTLVALSVGVSGHVAHAGATDTAARPAVAPAEPVQQPAEAAQPPQPATQTQPAQPPSAPAPPPQPVLSAAEQEQLEDVRAPALNLMTAVETLEKSVERNRESDAELASTRVEIEGLIEGAQSTWDNLGPHLEALRRQIEKLGPPPAKDAAPEAEQVATERARLNAMSAEVNGAIKTTELVQVRARQLYSEVQKLRQGIFAGQVLRRSPSPLSPATWQQLGSELSGASRQVGVVLASWLRDANKRSVELVTLLVAVVILFAALTAIVRRLLAVHLVADRDPPPTFFEQAATAGWVAPIMAIPAVATTALLGTGLSAMGLLESEVEYIAAAAMPALAIFISASALARAILQPRRPDWRLVDLADRPARILSRILTRIAGVYATDIVLQEVIRRLFLPLSISVLETALASIAIAALLIQFVRTPFDPKPLASAAALAFDAEPQGFEAEKRAILYPRLLKLPILLIAIAILSLSLLGYIGLGRFLAAQVVVTGSAVALVLLLHLAIRALLGGSGTGIRPIGAILEERTGLNASQSSVIAQALSVVLNTGLALFAVPLVLLTWGYSPREAISWLEAAIFGFEIGDFRISFARILLAALLFLGLVLATRLAQRWLETSVLKSKALDQGIANSIHTGVGYAGFLVAVLAAVSYGGLDITNFAIVAGALSVGIGFGLQSIVNNFVSGLILLVERPIKVGDWVSVKGQEGYVRRIAVRSTEIETFDRASLIVPNSDLITSTVTNWTHRNALGRVVIRVGVSYKSDPDQVREILERIGRECALVLQHPAPYVGFDNFGTNALEFSLGATVPDVNRAGTVQTELRTRILKEFRAVGIEMPHAQHDVHLRDLDVVRHIVNRLAEERMRQSANAASGASQGNGKTDEPLSG